VDSQPAGTSCHYGGFSDWYADCIATGGSGLHLDSLSAGCQNMSSDDKTGGRFRINLNGNLFIRSDVATCYHTVSQITHWHTWCHKDSNGTCQGWTFSDGDVLCGGFVKDNGSWISGSPACRTVHP
jgi:hypothetical protein